MTCIVPPSQPDYSVVANKINSGIPGNIGTVRTKVVIWDHDPLFARPFQKMTFPFSQDTAKQMRDSVPGIQFELNAAFLRPQFIPHDMFIATQNNHVTPNTTNSLDFVGSKQSGVGQIAFDRLPPSVGVQGKEYEANGFFDIKQADGSTSKVYVWHIGKDMFPHQVWLYVGSLLKRGVPIHPSEYTKNDTELAAVGNLSPATSAGCNFDKWRIEELQGAVKWDYNTIEDGAGHRAISPVQITKPAEDSSTPVHWTLEKLTQTFQGEDFFVTVVLGEKELSNLEDPNNPSDCVDTNWDEYKYLVYNPKNRPAGWIDGISNAAFFIEENKETPAQQGTIDARRDRYWWRYKSYILIEIGAGDPEHNYFIELVKGRKPRLLHLGTEWDNPNRLQQGGSISSADFRYIKKCRELSVYEGISTDELFKKKEFKVLVRSHLGRLVITFEGHEGEPWVISRLDNDPSRFNFSKILVPMTVPAGKMRIHGGNISATLNWSPVEYAEQATIAFKDRQTDTGKAKNSDVYMTFSHIGNSIRYDNPSFKRQYFLDPGLGYGKVGYDCDAFQTQEVIKNSLMQLPIYRAFNLQYKKYGKGWLNTTSIGNNGTLLPALVCGVDPARGGKPHKLEIINLRAPNQSFKFGLQESTDASYPYKTFVSKWDVGVRLKAGSVMMPKPTIDGLNSGEKQFKNVVTPIATSWSLIVLGGGKPIQSTVQPIDISELVTSINDSWSAEEFTTINHQMNMSVYIPLGIPVGGDPSQQSDARRPDLHSLGQKLLKLIDKSCYVSVSYWWDNGIGARDAVGNQMTRDGPPGESDLLIQMTGVAYGATIEKSVNKIFMNFKIMDYMSVLKNQMIFNSPFFDGVADAEAVYELMKLAHFDDSKNRQTGVDRRPLGFLQHVIEKGPQIADGKFTYNGETSRARRFDLPGSYTSVVSPAVRFQNGETFESAIKKISQQAAKVVYFDRWGVLRYENIPAIEAAFASGRKEDFLPVYEFRTTPFNVESTGGPGGSTENIFNFDPTKHAAHLVYNVVSYTRSVEDCVNQIVIMTASNDIQLADGSKTGGFLIEGYTFFDQIWDPNAEGFLGYRKPFYQSNGLFGGVEGIQNGILQYAKWKYPPAMISFQTYGIPGLKALDIITLDDDLFYITEITHEIDPSANNWWCNISGEWLKPFTASLGFLTERGKTNSGTPGAGAGSGG